MFSPHHLGRLFLNQSKQCRYLNHLHRTDFSNFKSKSTLKFPLNSIIDRTRRRFCSDSDRVKVNFILKDGSKVTIDGAIGQNVMEVAQENDIDIEGACAASLACCTCHVYVKQEYFDKLAEICDLEEDMLDQAPLLKENSRLSCQIVLTKELDNIEVQLPNVTRNFYVDGHVPKAH